MLAADVDHAYLSVLLAVNRVYAVLHIEARFHCARVLKEVLLDFLDHAYLSILLAVNRLSAVPHIEDRSLRA